MTIDLRTSYLGIELAHPIVPSASPVTGDLDRLRKLAAAGAPAVVLPSLFEEQVEREAKARGVDWSAEPPADAAGGDAPDLDTYNTGPVDYLELVRTARAQLDIPVIASLNGSTAGGWTLYARILADEGIDALELNVYLVEADPTVTSGQVEHRYLRLVESVRQAVQVPLAVKVGPYFASMANMAHRLVEAGADGLVLFNRFYQPDLDLERMEVTPNLALSTSSELRLVLRWIGILRGELDGSLAATTGIHKSEDVVKAILAGADVTMMASALLREGPIALTRAIEGLSRWLTESGYQSLEQAKGSLSRGSVADPTAFERANYMMTLTSYSPHW